MCATTFSAPSTKRCRNEAFTTIQASSNDGSCPPSTPTRTLTTPSPQPTRAFGPWPRNSSPGPPLAGYILTGLKPDPAPSTVATAAGGAVWHPGRCHLKDNGGGRSAEKSVKQSPPAVTTISPQTKFMWLPWMRTEI